MEVKQVIVVRQDLKLSKGKLAAQCSHASLEAYKKADPGLIEQWEDEGVKKVVLKVPGMKELMEIKNKVKAARLPYAVIKDAGKTELPAGTVTCLGIGPAKESDVDKITGRLGMV